LDEETAKVYGMIENIDDNLGRLFAKLKALDLEMARSLCFSPTMVRKAAV